ncbi:transcriptional regulator, AraC family [Flavobacterium glycines]|uniref:AraC family transcriptional regulator n=1 Tax=Flavobacterium glycines TaxID=551990 RepID=A0A1B9DS21_9FLAO|nr:AraC family transcriptional regulator [Flavobacterium glycines]OCB72484.1 cupin [Flavobacterium glycines]GEL09977.1 AraC family transcriptional regulator [Flavobacterium glycines]SDI86327.1 transcriptional regulator, AraC family [Flavobacterium glycines]
MKVLPFKIPKPEKEALVYQEDIGPVFYDQLHQHEEIQISYILKGRGTLIIGDSINEYKEDDILVIGENIPHVFRTDQDSSSSSEMLTLFFTKNSFGKDFFSLNDMSDIDDFFKKSEYGMKVLTKKKKIALLFFKLKNQNKIQRISSLLKILNHIVLAQTNSLSSFVSRKKYTEDEGRRMNDVFNYAISSFDKAITLEEVAEKANMTKNAFCRYFKKRTNKTFFQFLIEIRIENACKMLHHNKDLSISSISELSGFQDIANFNRKFKELKGVSPSQFRAQF